MFQGFEEGELNFLPTYKFIPGTDEYDNRPDKKLRPPAWCDRVLWRVRNPARASAAQGCTAKANEVPNLLGQDLASSAATDPASALPSGMLTVAQELRSPVEVLRREVEKSDVSCVHVPPDHYVRQLSYCRGLAPRISDHKPVSATFDCGLRKLVKNKELEIFLDFLRILDKMENAGVPKLDVKGLDIDAGLVQFKVIRRFCLANLLVISVNAGSSCLDGTLAEYWFLGGSVETRAQAGLAVRVSSVDTSIPDNGNDGPRAGADSSERRGFISL